MCLCKAFFPPRTDVCMPTHVCVMCVCFHVCVCVCVAGKPDDGWLISKQRQDFDRGVCQIFICCVWSQKAVRGSGTDR